MRAILLSAPFLHFLCIFVHLAGTVGESISEDNYSPSDMCTFQEIKWIGCNHCRCLWTWATWSCNRNVCSPLAMRGKRKECYHGDAKLKGCNHCACQYGKWVCGIQMCEQQCRDGSIKQQECNACYCIGGRYRCTEYPCIFHHELPCLPYSRKTMDCNECVCNKTGKGLTCTDMDCF